jgi:hypothetical protein
MCSPAIPRSPLFGRFVHVPCGQVRGYIEHVWSRCHCPSNLGRYQSCRCEPRERWEGCDVSEVEQLCILCARGSAGGPSRWAYDACPSCRDAADHFTTDPAFGLLLPLGRHSVMNQQYVQYSDDEATSEVATRSLLASLSAQDLLDTWRTQEVQRLGLGLAPNVPLHRWRAHHPVSAGASEDALARFYAAAQAGGLSLQQPAAKVSGAGSEQP